MATYHERRTNVDANRVDRTRVIPLGFFSRHASIELQPGVSLYRIIS